MNPPQTLSPHQCSEFAGPRGASIFWQSWRPDADPRGMVLLIHGLGEHSGRYAHVVQALLDLGLQVYALDHLGHGRSGGEREVVSSFDDLLQPVQQLRTLMEAHHPHLPLFVLGHSMGGLIATHHAIQHGRGISGLALSGPAVLVSPKVSAWTIAVGKWMAIVAPKVGVLGVSPEHICRDPAVVDAYVNDPLVFKGKTPARLAAELLKSMQALQSQRAQLQMPLLVMQGMRDRLVEPSGAAWLVKGAGSADKTLKEYPGLFHEIFNEPEQAEVIGDLTTWLKQRL